MEHLKEYETIFIETFQINKDNLLSLMYQSIPAWDSVGHMNLIAQIEETFDIMMDTDDIVDFSSFEKGKEILKKYNIDL